ncbi:RNA polymerase II subunit A C-terminal domain phosphatase [Anopheles maculipalpis]|uniref:RNA polymerase II subunit A C-terminal domain phosphatase n=1 Tax=Anopheles maculipalpis TaxID=1496333 RepID=UPI00215943DF|nr:RNA polymerase II subunit A C-terminal domain phosphatase [Anopheles maculipalpis]
MADPNQNIICAPDDCAIKISKWKVREGYPVTSGSIILFYELLDGSDKEVKRLKATQSGVVKKRLAREGATVAKGKPVLELGQCSHTTVIKDMCADCGADLRQDEPSSCSKASVPMIHSVPELKVTETLAKKLGQADTERLLNDRKLVLLVDLDQTLIHTTNDNVPNNLKDVYHFQLYGPNSPWYHTRLRPGALEFLAKMHPYYELHICTFGARNYAHMIAQFLDKDGNFFSHRILSRDECFNATSKTDNLKALFPCGDSMVCIIDDREDVWNMASNLIQVKPYHFFQHTGDINAPPGMSKNELDGKGVDFKELMSQSLKEKKAKDGDDEGRPPTPKIQTQDGGNGKQQCEKSMPEHVLDDKTEDEPTTEAEKPVEKEEESKECETTPPEADRVEPSTASSKEDSNCTSEDEKVEIQHTVKETNETLLDEKGAIDPEKEKRTAPAAPLEEPKELPASDEAKDTATETDKQEEPPGENDCTSDSSAKEDKKPTLNSKQEKDLIEIEDPDDYLLYLEHILLKIHKTFYEQYDQTQTISDLKQLIPTVKARVLVGTRLCFSGLIPNTVKLEQSKAFLIARSLGAVVTQNLEPTTTHLVAVTIGTSKVNNARKNAKIKIVTPEWLWSCAERWEHVEEQLFPLKASNPAKMRQPPPHCHSPEHAVNYGAMAKSREEPKFMDTVNPLLSFSNDDLDAMNNDFDDFFESDDSSSDDEPVDIENPPMEKALRKRKRVEEIETNRGRHNIFRKRTEEEEQRKEENRRILKYDNNAENNDENSQTNASSEDEEDESPSAKFRRGGDLPSDLDMGSNSEGSEEPIDDVDDGDWNMMGAALEREFLGLDD